MKEFLRLCLSNLISWHCILNTYQRNLWDCCFPEKRGNPTAGAFFWKRLWQATDIVVLLENFIPSSFVLVTFNNSTILTFWNAKKNTVILQLGLLEKNSLTGETGRHVVRWEKGNRKRQKTADNKQSPTLLQGKTGLCFPQTVNLHSSKWITLFTASSKGRASHSF